MRPVIASTNHNHQNTQLQATNDLSIPTVSILTHSTIAPIAHENIQDCFQQGNPHSTQWKYTAFHQCNKNASYRVFTKPQPIKTLPPGIDILISVLATTIKPTDTRNI